MSFKDTYPDFAAIQGHIKRANAERSVYIASHLTDAILGAVRGLKRLVQATSTGIAAEREVPSTHGKTQPAYPARAA